MLDFYLIVSDYREAYGRGWLAFANRLIPPNVFPFEHQGLVAKYAVLSEADLGARMRPEAGSVSVWARFAQPSRLVWAKDEAARRRTVASVAAAAPTLFALTRPTMAKAQDDPLDVFRAGFALTYGAELRAERKERPGSIVDADPERYRRLGARGRWPGRPAPSARRRAAARAWRRRRRKGKALTLVRLAKASTTFAGGDRLSRLEDQPPRRHRDRGEAVAAALAAARRAHSAAAPVESGARSVEPCRRARSADLDRARRERGDGERLAQQFAAGQSSASPASPT